MIVTEEMKKSTAFKYADDVRSGRIIVGKYIMKAVLRFYDWIEKAHQKGYHLDHDNGQHVIIFFEMLIKHTKGVKAGEYFHLSPYQQFTLYNLFAWKKKNSDGKMVRVIKTVYEKVARKNGKTALLAGLGLYCQAFDDEQGSEIYVGATKEAQAKILWEQAHAFVYKGLNLRKIGFENTQREIRFKNGGNTGVFRFLGGDSKTLDGLNPSVSIIDEYHAHKDDTVREVLESAMGAREQPIIYIITTAGFNLVSACKLWEDVCKQILDNIKEDDSTFIMIHEMDSPEDWQNENEWVKANPNLGVSIGLDYLKSEFTKVVNQPSKAPNFKTKHLNLWVDSFNVWIPDDIWMANKVDIIPLEKFAQYGSFVGSDLSTTTDITSVIFLSEPDENDDRYLMPYFFCPKDTVDKRSSEDRAPYRYWVDSGHLIATPGNTVDYEYVKDCILRNYYPLNAQRVELDQWNASQLANDLAEKGINVSFFSQQISVISHPTKEFEKFVYRGKIKHDGNPILRWMIGGCVIYQDANENIKVHKGQSHAGNKRVDGVIGSIMALGGSLSIPDTSTNSQYNQEDVEIYI